MLDYEGFHDNVESWWCGKNLKYEFCDNVDGDCSWNRGISGAGNIKSPLSGHPNEMDKITLQYYDPIETGAVTAFTNLHCENWAGRLDAAEDPELIYYYNSKDLGERHLIDQQISSVAIPQGYTLKLYKFDGFVESEHLTLNGEPWSDSIHTMKCVDLEDYDWDDHTSSAAVYRTNRGALAQGFW